MSTTDPQEVRFYHPQSCCSHSIRRNWSHAGSTRQCCRVANRARKFTYWYRRVAAGRSLEITHHFLFREIVSGVILGDRSVGGVELTIILTLTSTFGQTGWKLEAAECSQQSAQARPSRSAPQQPNIYNRRDRWMYFALVQRDRGGPSKLSSIVLLAS